MQAFESSSNNNTKNLPPVRWTKHHIWGRLSLCLLSTWVFCLVSLHDYSILLHPPQSDFGFAPPSRVRRVTAAAGGNQNSSNSSSAPWNSTAAGLVVVAAAGADLPEPNNHGPSQQRPQIFQTRPQQSRRSVKEQHVLEKKPYHQDNNSNQYDSSKPKHKKKHLIFHVGPSKTATTFLQTELTKLVNELKRDHYIYTGRFYYPSTSKLGRSHTTSTPKNHTTNAAVQWKRDWTQLHQVARQMLKRKHCKQKIIPRSQCLNDFRNELIQLNSTQNILLSDESWGPQSWKTAEDYQALQELATRLGYELTIVVGYRPFFEWIRSDLFQRHRLDTLGKSTKKTAWPDGTNSSNSTAQVMPWLFPDYFHRNIWHDQHIHRFTDFVVENARDYVDHFKILHLHNPNNETLVTQFACQVLPDAPTTCKKSQETNYSSHSTGNHNAQSSQYSSSRTILHHHHDLVATQAAALGLIDTNRYSRQLVRESLRDFMEHTLGQSPVLDYPIQCPSQQQLDEFLAESLQLEEVCLGKEGAARQEEHTHALFQKYVQDHSFCMVDAVAALNNENLPYAGFLQANFGFGNGTLSLT